MHTSHAAPLLDLSHRLTRLWQKWRIEEEIIWWNQCVAHSDITAPPLFIILTSASLLVTFSRSQVANQMCACPVVHGATRHLLPWLNFLSLNIVNCPFLNHKKNTKPAEPVGYGCRKMQIKPGYEFRCRHARKKWDLFLQITILCVSPEIINSSTCGPMFYSAERSRNRFAHLTHNDDVFCTSRLKS